MARILIAGGYGAFGARAAERLAREPDLEIIIAGRSAARARAAAAELGRTSRARIDCAVLDVTQVRAAQLAELSPAVVINASGPYQAQDYGLARACIEARCHCIDLADARAFVTGIGVLDAEAKAAGVAVISGASTVPGVSSAVVRHFSSDFACLEEIDIGVSPGNSFDPGLATMQSVLDRAGKPVPVLSEGRVQPMRVWHGLHRRTIPGLGRRWLGHVDAPDLDLLPKHYPALRSARVWAGAEVGLFHLGIWALSGLVRMGLVESLAPLAGLLLAGKRRLRFLGSDEGGMFVAMRGTGRDGGPKAIEWSLVARQGHGPYVPAIASVVLARRLARGEATLAGARPCFGLVTLEEFQEAVRDLDISCTRKRGP